MSFQETQGVQIKGRSPDDFATLTADGVKQRLDVSSNPLDRYAFSQYEETASYLYVLYESAEGAWLMKRLTSATGKMEFAIGSSDISTAWTNRASLTYRNFSEVF